ncbi:MAG: NUDIX hydrolase [Betaproteobacteria bacterium]|nr:MAG: NUDIX hydrolase [Betaproteobacteria bacterium]
MAVDPRPGRSVVSSDRHLEETHVEGARVFDGALLDVRRDIVRLPDGATTIREYIVHPQIRIRLMVRAPDAAAQLVQLRQAKPIRAIDDHRVGGRDVDAGESALATAQRELTEETGYIAARWTRLGLIHPTVSYSTEAIEIFVADDLTHVGRKLDDGEFLDVAQMTGEALLAALDEGELTDAKTVAALLMYFRKRGGP